MVSPPLRGEQGLIPTAMGQSFKRKWKHVRPPEGQCWSGLSLLLQHAIGGGKQLEIHTSKGTERGKGQV